VVARYATDLTDAEWALLEPLIPKLKPRGQPRLYPLREIVNALLYLLQTGAAWRHLPRDLPPWSLVSQYFYRWRDNGTLERIHGSLRERLRQQAERDPQPSAAVLDSQSVKTMDKGGARLRRRHASEGAQAALVGRHQRTAAEGAGASGRCSGSRGRSGAAAAREAVVPAHRAGLGRLRLQGRAGGLGGEDARLGGRDRPESGRPSRLSGAASAMGGVAGDAVNTNQFAFFTDADGAIQAQITACFASSGTDSNAAVSARYQDQDGQTQVIGGQPQRFSVRAAQHATC
jgi:transposase